MIMIKSNRVSKILFLAAVLILMLGLCGCRTRVTNNSEVTNVMYDEDGMLSEEYDMRREELELSIAKKPIITGWGTSPEDESEYYDDDDADMLEEYDPDAFEGPDDDDEEKPNASTATGRRTTSTTRPSSTRPSGSGGTTVSRVKITLDANGGKSNINVTYRTANGQYGALPTPTREGYKFKGWYTKKEGGTKITSTTKIKGNQGVTLYAQWEKDKKTKPKKEEKTDPEPSKPEEPEKPEEKTHTVTFDVNGDGASIDGTSEITVTEGKAYGNLPSASWTYHTFEGWYTEQAEGAGTQIKASSVFNGTSDQTLYAHWTKKSKEYWQNEFEVAANEIKPEEKIDCCVDSDGKSIIEDCKGNVVDPADSDTICVVKFIKDIDLEKAQEAADEIKSETETEGGKYYGKTVDMLLVDKKALEDDKEIALVYKLAILNYLYGIPSKEEVENANSELDVNIDPDNKIFKSL